MAVTRISQSSIKEGLEKFPSFYGGLSGLIFGQYDSIQTITVGASGASAIEFTNIPQTYQHLQVRGIVRENNGNNHVVLMQINNDSTTGRYTQHHLLGTGSAPESSTFNNSGISASTFMFSADNPVDTPSGFILDIFDYTSTTKAKVGKCLWGFDTNGTANGASQYGLVGVSSTLYTQTSAITQLKFIEYGVSFRQFTTFALYGLKAP